MEILGTSTSLLFAAISKTLAGTIFDDKPFFANISQELIDKIKGVFESPPAHGQANQAIEKLAMQVVNNLQPLIDLELRNIHQEMIENILSEVDNTLNAAKISVIDLIDHNLDSMALESYLLQVNMNATTLLSADEAALYQRIIGELSKAIIRIAPQMPYYDPELSRYILREIKSIKQEVHEIWNARLKDFREFEEKYLQSLTNNLNYFEHFGIKRMNNIYESQKLIDAYIDLSISIDINSILNIYPRISKNDLSSFLTNSISGLSIDHFKIAFEGFKKLVHPFPSKKFELISHQSQQSSFFQESDLQSYNINIDTALKIVTSIQSGPGTRVILRGDAGAGKSTFLQWIAVSAARRTLGKDFERVRMAVPFFIRLRTLVGKEFPTPDEFPSLVSPNYGKNVPNGWVHSLLESGRAIILIDGVDELPRNQRDKFLQNLKQLVADFPSAHYIITSRPSGLLDNSNRWDLWETWVQKNQFISLMLNPMSIAHINSFIQHWHHSLTQHTNYERSGILSRIRPLQNLLRQRPELRTLATNPLLCAMICALYHERQETLPSGRNQLYKECIELMLSRRDSARHIPLDEIYPLGLSDDQKIAFLQNFASWLMRNNRSDAERDEVDEKFTQYIPSTGLPTSITGSQIRSFFVERAGILREPVLGIIDFAHRTFQEYLAAKSILEDNSIDELLNYVTNDQWRETIIVAVGLARPKERTRFLEGLLEKSEKQPDQQLYLRTLALACLETSLEVEVPLRARILEAAKDLLPPDSGEEAIKLARLGNAIIPLLEYDVFATTHEMLMSIETLAHIGTTSALLMLKEYLKTTDILALRRISQLYKMFDIQQYKEYILQNLSLLSVDNLTTHEISIINEQININSLSINNGDNNSLKLLENCLNISDLDIKESINLDSIWNLSHLDYLHIKVSADQDLIGIKKLKNLSRLGLDFEFSRNQDLSILSELSKLRTIEINNLSSMKNISSLNKLKHITEIFISNDSNSYPNINLHDINNFPYLKKLHIIKYNIILTEPLILPSLQELKIQQYISHKSEAIDMFNELSSLENLGLIVRSQNMNFLKDLKGLKYLQIIPVNDIDNIDYISYTPQLESLHLGIIAFEKYTHSQSIRTKYFSALPYLTNLQELFVSYSLNIDLDIISSLINLKKLKINANKESKLIKLDSLENLEFLRIEINESLDLKSLVSLKSIKHLVLSADDFFPPSNLNSIDLEPLKNIPSLETVYIQGIPIKNLDKLKNTTNIKLYGEAKIRREWNNMGGQLFIPQPMFRDGVE